MLLATNITNSVISVGFFSNDACKLIGSFKLSCNIDRTADEYLIAIRSVSINIGIDARGINGVIISSVVPQITQKIKNTLREFSGCDPIVVGPGVKTGFHIKIDNPSELGGDMVANATATMFVKQKNKGAIIADIGTVTTVSAINRNGEYIGCSIFPGVQMSLDVLHRQTARLPNINYSDTAFIIGKNSQEAIRSGIVIGHALMLDGFVERFSAEMKCKTEFLELIATGEYANTIIKECKNRFFFDENLTLKGLYYIYKNTIKL